jgi:fatty acid synthase subunit beta
MDAPRLLLQFPGQGTKYLDELRRTYATAPSVRPFVDEAIAAIGAQAALYDDSGTGFFRQGLEVARWMEHPDRAPDFGYLLSSPLSYPLIYLCQMANYLALFQDGLEPRTLLRHTHCATGFSTGIVAAALSSMDLSLDQLQRRALRVQALFFWAGIRVQECTLKRGVRPELRELLDETDLGSPSCMARIDGPSRHHLEEKLRESSGDGLVSVGYVLAPARCVIAGMPADLAAFHEFLAAGREPFTWRYILSTTPAHSPYHEDALEPTLADARRLGLDLDAREMKVPVLSVTEGKDLRESADLLRALLRGYLVDLGFWRRQIAPLFGGHGITDVLDLGPGTGIAGLTASHLGKAKVRVIRCAVPVGRDTFLRELQPALVSDA